MTTTKLAEAQTPQRLVSAREEVSGYKVLELLSHGKHLADANLTIADMARKERAGQDWSPSWSAPIVVITGYSSHRETITAAYNMPRSGVPLDVQQMYYKMYGYPEPEKPNDQIIFNVPKEYQGKSYLALVLDSSTIRIKNLGHGTKLLLGTVLKAQDYPMGESGWFAPDKDTGIPTRVRLPSSDPAAVFCSSYIHEKIVPLLCTLEPFYPDNNGPTVYRPSIRLDRELDERHSVSFVENDGILKSVGRLLRIPERPTNDY
jgi:hypothetical protein